MTRFGVRYGTSAAVLIANRVADYDAWKTVFDDHMQARKDAALSISLRIDNLPERATSAAPKRNVLRLSVVLPAFPRKHVPGVDCGVKPDRGDKGTVTAP